MVHTYLQSVQTILAFCYRATLKYADISESPGVLAVLFDKLRQIDNGEIALKRLHFYLFLLYVIDDTQSGNASLPDTKLWQVVFNSMRLLLSADTLYILKICWVQAG